jgi:hypothetical protein
MLYAHVDAFLGETLRVICRATPEVLRTGKQLTWKTALSFTSMDELTDALAEQFTYEFGWKTLADRLEFLRNSFGVNLNIPNDELQLLREFEHRRHLIIHNGGFVTDKYITDTANAKMKAGERISISRAEVRSLGHAVVMLGSDLFSEIAVRCLGAKPSDLTRVWKRQKDRSKIRRLAGRRA